jgi:hypothetical protein
MRNCDICGRLGTISEISFLRVANKLCCKKHRHQYEKFKKFLDSNPRTIQDKNEIIEYDDYAEIILYNIHSEEVARAAIDKDDIVKIKNMKWRFSQHRVSTDVGNTVILLHRFLMNINKENFVVDHIDRNIFNNRKINLRICTQHENTFNCSLSKNNTSGVSGISWSKGRNKFEAQISINGKNKHLGRYINIEDAIIARLKAEKYYFKEFAPQKHLFEKYGIV